MLMAPLAILAPVAAIISVIAISHLEIVAARVSAGQPTILARARRWLIAGSISRRCPARYFLDIGNVRCERDVPLGFGHR